MSDLRIKLEHILGLEHTQDSERMVLQLVSSYPEAFVESVPIRSEKKQVFNCFMYALSLVDRVEPNVIKLEDGSLKFIVNSTFFRKLIGTGVLIEASAHQLEPKDLVVYYNGQEKMHVALYLAPNLVESKWGPGPLFRHGLWDVPESYGDKLRYFKRPEQSKVDALLGQELPGVQLAPHEPL